MKTFSQVNKKAVRFCCCLGSMKIIDLNKKCDCDNEGITFYEYLTEKLSYIFLGEKIPLDIIRGDSGELIIPANRKITKTFIRKIAANYEFAECDPSPIRNIMRRIIGETAQKFSMEIK